MSHLPDDIAQWPTDPFDLLGAEPGADEKTLKRAYMRLIRKYRPEHAPEQFKRIREAYEFATSPVATAFGRWSENNPAAVTRATSDVHRPSVKSSSLDEIWSTFRDGDEWDARRQLEARYANSPVGQQVLTRLYWVRKLDPEDKNQAIVRWLIGHLQRHGDLGGARNLLLGELKARPELALDDDISRLLIGTDIEHHLDIFEVRWKEAIRQGNFRFLRDDLANVADQLAFEREVFWARIMIRVSQMLLLANPTDNALLDEQCTVLGRLRNEHILPPHLEQSVGNLLAFRDLRIHRPNVLHRILPVVMACEWPSPLGLDETVVDEWQRNHMDAICELDIIGNELTWIVQTLRFASAVANERLNSAESAVPAERVEEFVRKLVNCANGVDEVPVAFRLCALEFCVRENVSTSQLSVLLMEVENKPPGIAKVSVRLMYDHLLTCLADILRLHRQGW